MADILTTSNINSLVNSYISSETSKLITPLQTRKTKYSSISSIYDTLNTKLTSFKSVLSDLKISDTSSVFKSKTAKSSDESVITATASNSAAISSFNMRVNQLAKNDVVVSQDLSSSTAVAISGTQTFTINTGDGSGGEYTSTVNVDFTGSETNQTMIEKIQDAINSDKAEVQSNYKSTTASYTGGASTFTIDINGTSTDVTVNGGGTYDDLMTELVSNINSNVDGVTAEKVYNPSDPTQVSLKLTVNDSSKYISVSASSGFDVVSDLNIGVTKEKGASGIVSASAFSPVTGSSQLSITSRNTGVDYRITNLADSGTSTALSSLGLNLGSSRPTFDQAQSPDTPGFLYSDITDSGNQLNAKITYNGLSIQRNSNTIDDLTNGVTLTLHSVSQTTDNDVNLTVQNDVDKIKSKISNFISKFNDVYTYIKSQSTVTTDGRGKLVGDLNSSTIKNYMSALAYTPVTGLSQGSIDRLSELGLSFDTTNGLSISDSAKLEDQISTNASQVEDFFNSSDGIANKLYSELNPYLGSSGYLESSKTSYQNNINSINDRISAAQKRIDKESENLRNRYEQLQAQLASLMTTQSFFSTGVSSFF